MRSSTTFLVFLGLVVVVVLFGVLQKVFTERDPVVQTATRFMAAVQQNDAAAIEALTDPATGTFTRAGNHVVSLSFTTIVPFEGAYVKRPAVTWSYNELASLTLANNTEPVVVSNEQAAVATLALNRDFKLYLRQVEGEWKIFYLDKAEDKKK